jgi:hypothetical protein
LSRLAVFERALIAVRALQRKHDRAELRSVVEQLEYLIGLEKDETANRSNLPRLTMGLIAARMIEQLDESTAELIYQADVCAREMIGSGDA